MIIFNNIVCVFNICAMNMAKNRFQHPAINKLSKKVKRPLERVVEAGAITSP
jgi:hypothetical protein